MIVRAIIQARMSSTRLRGKTLMPLAGTPLLKRVIDSVRKNKFIDEIVVATSDFIEDDPIDAYCQYLKIDCIRGNKHNVFARFELACRDLEASDHIVRITGDNSFCRVEQNAKIFKEHINRNLDYSCVEGLSHTVYEIIKVQAIRDLSKRQTELSDYQKEHVTPVFREVEQGFNIQITCPHSLSLKPDLDKLLTIDTKDDLLRIEKMIQELSINHKTFDFDRIYDWLLKNK